MGARRPLAKLTAPTLPALVPRPRLLKLLDRARKRKLVWIEAIPGSGKTSLVASYLRARRQRCLWLSLDEADSDPATFLHYLRLAAEAARPLGKQPLPRLVPAYLPELPVFAQRFFAALYERLGSATAIVLDNYQTLHAESFVHELLRIAAQHSSGDAPLFVMSRAGPPAVLARLQANRQMDLIGGAELRLTETETTQLVRLHAPQRQRRDRAAEGKKLHAAAGGWLAGTLLLLMHAGETNRAPVSSTPKLLFDYFAAEVLAELDELSRKVLLETALLPSMTASMAHALTGEAGAGRIIASLQRAGYFTELHAEAPARYQYHPLFREFLLSRSAATSTSEQLSELRDKAAALLLADGQAEAAIALWIAARRFDAAAAAISAQAPLLIGQGRASAVIEWIAAVPEAARDEAPWLWYWFGAAHLAIRPMSAQPLLERALNAFERTEDRIGAVVACAAILDAISYAWRDVPQLDVWIERLADLITRAGESLPPPIEATVACAMFYALFWRRPGDVRFMAWVANVERVIETAPDLDLRITAVAVALLNAYVNRGDLARAERVLRIVEERAGSRGWSPFAQLACFQMRSVLAYTTGKPALAKRAAVEGLAFAVQHGISFWSLPLLGAQGLAELQLGDVAAAQHTVARLVEQARHGVMVFRSWTLTLESWVEQELGDVAAAHRAAQSALELTLNEGPFPETLGRFSLAQTEHALGHKAAAAAHLARLGQIARESRCPTGEIGWRCMAAQFALADGDAAAALAELRVALGLGAKLGYFEWQCRIPRGDLALLFAKALEAGIETEYVSQLIRCRNLLPSPTAAHVEAWPWPIKIYCLGRFALVREDGPVTFAGKAQERPLLLLKVLLALGGRDVEQGRIAAVLWPQADGDAAVAAFNTTLKRLRVLLGRPDAVTLSAGRVDLNPRVCWVDTWAFERGVRLAASHSDAAESVLASYRGPFLGAEDRSWSVPARERLQARFLRSLRAFGSELQEHGRWADAADLYQRGLDADDSAEELYQRLMVCHERLGQPGEALAAYRRCKSVLKARAGVEPGKKTQALYERICKP